ncbi:hypothetical protein KHS38_08495 [Mucilaginibacter sp. Bleaf8]|uniref:hypothetical protein n=1 Tax=Mucilaginibacter sp. Bleaf8 TaxID=2834430 RepID=UPI001BCBBA38|nr:hypothetical protein [Mucilaginibacter sp. Bleaf8]MBS7564444.1 hypothetical protein [Mucilaginibacter sp. Bleaf8]
MKKLLLPILAAVTSLVASCSTYQISTISSTNSIKDDKTGVFYFENDSVKISYSFYGNNAPISIKVYNKLDKPLYVDWQRSAAIVGNEAYSYASDKVNINGNINALTYNDNNWNRRAAFGALNLTSGSLNAVAELPKNITFLPPHAQIANVPLNLTQGTLHVPESSLHKEKVKLFGDVGDVQANVKTADFTKENSPLLFKSYLTLYTQNGSEVKPVAFQHEFYVSKVVSTQTEPGFFPQYQVQRGDFFFNNSPIGDNKALAAQE